MKINLTDVGSFNKMTVNNCQKSEIDFGKLIELRRSRSQVGRLCFGL